MTTASPDLRLADTPERSPEDVGADVSPPSPPPPSPPPQQTVRPRFTVSYATDPPLSQPRLRSASPTVHSGSSTTPAATATPAAASGAAARPLRREAVTLTPSSSPSVGSGVAKPSKGGQTAPHHRRLSPSRSLNRDVEAANTPLREEEVVEEMEGELEEEEEVLFSAVEVQQRVQSALSQYEQQRDAEEEAVLQQVSREVEAQAARHAALQESFAALEQEKAALRREVAGLTEKCEELERTAQTARGAQQRQQAEMRQMEVELCHARDATRHTAGRVAEASQAERRLLEATAKETQEELHRVKALLSVRDAEMATLQEQRTKEAVELAELRQLRDTYEGDCAAIQQRLSQLAENMTAMEITLGEREQAVAQLQQQLLEEAAQHQSAVGRCDEEKAALQKQLSEAQDTLRQQADEVRRRMHRVTQLSKQKTLANAELAEVLQSVSLVSQKHHRFVELLRRWVRRLQKKSAHPRRHSPPAAAPSLPPVVTSHSPPPDADETFIYDAAEVDEYPSDVEEATVLRLLMDTVAGGSVVTPVGVVEDEDRAADDDDSDGDRDDHDDERAAGTPKRQRCSPRLCETAAPPLSSSRSNTSRSASPQAVAEEGRSAKETLQGLSDEVATAAQLLYALQRLWRTSRRPVQVAEREHMLKLEQACLYVKLQLQKREASLQLVQQECERQTREAGLLEAEVVRLRQELAVVESSCLVQQRSEEEAASAQRNLEQQRATTAELLDEAKETIKELEEALQVEKAKQEVMQRDAELTQQEVEQLKGRVATEAAKTKSAAEESAGKEEDHATVVRELETLKERHKATQLQLQACRAQQASRHLKEQRDGQVAAQEMAQLRATLTAEVGSIERALLQQQRKHSVLQEQYALRETVEEATLTAILQVLSPLMPEAKPPDDAERYAITPHQKSSLSSSPLRETSGTKDGLTDRSIATLRRSGGDQLQRLRQRVVACVQHTAAMASLLQPTAKMSGGTAAASRSHRRTRRSPTQATGSTLDVEVAPTEEYYGGFPPSRHAPSDWQVAVGEEVEVELVEQMITPRPSTAPLTSQLSREGARGDCGRSNAPLTPMEHRSSASPHLYAPLSRTDKGVVQQYGAVVLKSGSDDVSHHWQYRRPLTTALSPPPLPPPGKAVATPSFPHSQSPHSASSASSTPWAIVASPPVAQPPLRSSPNNHWLYCGDGYRSASIDGGLTNASRSISTGHVDGYSPPARPPSLRARSSMR